jgi:hypothetical protein
MISQRLADFDDEFKSLFDALTSAMIEMYEVIIQKLIIYLIYEIFPRFFKDYYV